MDQGGGPCQLPPNLSTPKTMLWLHLTPLLLFLCVFLCRPRRRCPSYLSHNLTGQGPLHYTQSK